MPLKVLLYPGRQWWLERHPQEIKETKNKKTKGKQRKKKPRRPTKGNGKKKDEKRWKKKQENKKRRKRQWRTRPKPKKAKSRKKKIEKNTKKKQETRNQVKGTRRKRRWRARGACLASPVIADVYGDGDVCKPAPVTHLLGGCEEVGNDARGLVFWGLHVDRLWMRHNWVGRLLGCSERNATTQWHTDTLNQAPMMDQIWPP